MSQVNSALGGEPSRHKFPFSRNNVRKLREALLMSKAELARRAGVSSLTIDRIEAGHDCRMDTKRKVILALGLKLTERHKVFADQEDAA
ncbi:MAG: helix-turn-helix domain-containing protein [Deltaproteobacteria bacterium]|nr:helix-turn-helix domain-containing protein [Deltaproteobacteria bacterium]